MSQKGLVAYFDILGYQNIIGKNLIEDVSNIISDVLLELPKVAKEEFLTRFKAIVSAFFQPAKLCDDIKVKIISDSIILFLELPEQEDSKDIAAAWLFFLLYVAILLERAFEKGLPLRGVVDYGDFFLKENCFAGKPLINCYRLAHQLELSGAVLSEEGAERLENTIKSDNNLFPFAQLFAELAPTYLVPVKGGEKHLPSVNWVVPLKNRISLDIRQYVSISFFSHNKDISQAVMGKLNNTEMMIRFFLRLYR